MGFFLKELELEEWEGCGFCGRMECGRTERCWGMEELRREKERLLTRVLWFVKLEVGEKAGD